MWTWPVAATAIAALLALISRLRVIALVGAGYKAKVLCTARFASGREMDPHAADEVFADSYWILRPFRASFDATSQSVTASFFGLLPRTAVFRTGYGATLLSPETEFAAVGSTSSSSAASRGRRTPLDASGPAIRRQGHGGGSAGTALARVVERAFGEPNPHRLRRTHAVVVLHDGTVVAERYARGVTADTPLPGWSMAKSVLNALVGLLVADGRLRLDQRELFPAWHSPDPRSTIELEDLLRMRSGLRFSESYGNPWSDVLHMLFNCGDSAAYAASRPLAAAPGTVWQYASGTTNLLSAIVRSVVGDAEYGSWPARMLFDRAGMNSAVLEPDAAGTFVCSSFMVATALDWGRYGQLWLDRGRYGADEILPRSWIDFSTAPTPQSPGGRYGAHWWLKLQPEMGGDDPAARSVAPDAFFAVGHEAQTLTIIPSKRLVVVRMGAAIYVDAWNHARFIAELQDRF
jgi:CubicO group peptidase (beta-lactamase class C family)